jgi:hypothetical protein
MEKIKQQIENLITFKAESLEDLYNEQEVLKDRLNQGLENMKESGLFSTKEISEIKEFANQLFCDKYNGHKLSIVNKAREEFVF